jgi:hypothetical protein
MTLKEKMACPSSIERENNPGGRPQVSHALLEVLLGAGEQRESSLGWPASNLTRIGTLVKAAFQTAVRIAPGSQTGSSFRDRVNLQFWLSRTCITFARLLACLRAPVPRPTADVKLSDIPLLGAGMDSAEGPKGAHKCTAKPRSGQLLDRTGQRVGEGQHCAIAPLRSLSRPNPPQ